MRNIASRKDFRLGDTCMRWIEIKYIFSTECYLNQIVLVKEKYARNKFAKKVRAR